jgi:chemotaxis protein methyltransferase CheR
MQQLGCHDVRAYLKLLNNNPNVKEQNEYLMTVSISRFFRDREFWIALEEKILPGLFTNEDRKIKVWSAGCACGEEVYSFKILWERLEKHVGTLPMMEILATDLHPAYLKAARSGVYSSSSLKEVDHQDRERFFRKTDRKNRYQVMPEIKDNIHWQVHHLSSDPPDRNFRVIFLRNNILTYYQTLQKTAMLKKVVDALAPMGLLVIGSRERLPSAEKNLSAVQPFPYVFRRY